MGQLVFQAALGGQVNLVGPNTASTLNINVPAFAGTMSSLASVTANGVEYVNSSGQPTSGSTFVFDGTNVGIGTASPSYKFDVQTSGATVFNFQTSATNGGYGVFYAGSSTCYIGSTKAFLGTGTAADFGIVNTGSNNLVFGTASAERMRIDSSGNVGIGTTTPGGKFTIVDNAGGSGVATTVTLTNGVDANCYLNLTGSSASDKRVVIGPSTGTAIAFQTNATERMRIDSSGNLLVGQSSTIGTGGKLQVLSTQDTLYSQTSSSTAYAALVLNVQNTAARLAAFQYGNTTAVGTITTNGTTTAYNTSSDYRLKNTIIPMTGALAKVAALKPVTYKWNADGSDGQGFIAHELAEVESGCVNGEKDAVDSDGNPIYQGVDTSFLIATLTAAIQEQQALITALTARITALEAK